MYERLSRRSNPQLQRALTENLRLGRAREPCRGISPFFASILEPGMPEVMAALNGRTQRHGVTWSMLNLRCATERRSRKRRFSDVRRYAVAGEDLGIR